MAQDFAVGFEISNDQADQMRSLFSRPDSKPQADPNIYTTKPADSISEDGHYRSVIRILTNPFNQSKSLVTQVTYFLRSIEGNRVVRSKSADGTRGCPIVDGFMRLWRNPDKKDYARQMFNRTESKWALIQVIEDENKPELKGKILLYKLAKDIITKLQQLMAPANDSKVQKLPYPVMDYIVGLALNIDVTPGPDDPKNPQRKTREISYNLSNFGEYTPIIKTDGTNFFTDDEIEIIDTYASAAADARTGKTEAKRTKGLETLKEIKPKILPLYTKTIEYIKTAAVTEDGKPMDPAELCTYHEWDEETTTFVNQWVERVVAGVNPENVSYIDFKNARDAGTPAAQQTQQVQTQPAAAEAVLDKNSLPF